MPSLLLACALVTATLVACSGAAPATATAPTALAATAVASPQAGQPLCDAAYRRQPGLFFAETCRSSTEACADQARERMISWVTAEVVAARRLDALQQKAELPRELEAYKAVDVACTARLGPPALSPGRRFVDGRVAAGPRAARAIRSSSR